MAGLLSLAPASAQADVAAIFASSRQIDPLTELDYRVRFPTPDHLERFEPPADRIGRERVDEARERVARAYLREITEAVADEVLEQLPLLAYLERRYDEITTFRLGGDGSRSDRPPRAGTGQRSLEPGRFSAALVHRLPPVRRPLEDTTEIRLRPNGGGLSLSLAPTVEVTRGSLRCRIGYRFSGDRVELALSRRLFRTVELELNGSESLAAEGTQLAVLFRIAF